MASVSDKHGPFRQCIQILGTLDMYPDFGYIAIFGLSQDKGSQGYIHAVGIVLRVAVLQVLESNN